jgi:hypothetical protein
MAAKDKAAKAAAAAQTAKENPYLQRIIQDEDLRDNMVVAVEAARNAYNRLNKGKAPAKNLIEDKKLHAAQGRDPREGQAQGRHRPPAAPRDRWRCHRDRHLRGPAQQGARCAVRRRGGVRLHLQHDARPAGRGARADDLTVTRCAA